MEVVVVESRVWAGSRAEFCPQDDGVGTLGGAGHLSRQNLHCREVVERVRSYDVYSDPCLAFYKLCDFGLVS